MEQLEWMERVPYFPLSLLPFYLHVSPYFPHTDIQVNNFRFDLWYVEA